MDKRKKILMFGWEFPPVISGGLGVATLGLSKALAQLADVKLILPKNVPNFDIENIELVGLNNISVRDLPAVEFASEMISLFKSNRKVIGPYTHIAPNEYLDQTYFDSYEKGLKPFEIEELYAGDVVSKVIAFERIAVAYCLNQDFDIIHAHDWLTFLPAMHLKIKTGKPLVIHIHSTEIDRTGGSNNNWVFALEKKAMEMADRIIPVSNYTGEICVKYYGADSKKIMPVHNGISRHQPIQIPKHKKGNLVVFFGRITMQKGPEYFIEAAQVVLNYLPNTRFVMAGSGDLLNSMILKVAELGLGDKIYFTHFLNKVKLEELLLKADLYCMPSRSEPFGLSAVEAAQYGIPIIISNTSGVSEVLPGAMKIDFDDVKKLASYIIATLTYKGLRKAVLTADNKSLKDITWENSALEVMKVYASLFANEKIIS